jgi:LmbE family N-acetylglucosaminyl deacetylase
MGGVERDERHRLSGMLTVGLEQLGVRHVLCLGAHSDDLEIGCGGTILRLMESPNPPSVTWVVLSADAVREVEALRSAEALLQRAASTRIVVKKFRDGYLPYEGALVKDAFEELKATVSPDLVLTPYRGDLHQDHRLVAELTWNTFRDHLILEYEVPKYDGDLAAPNFFVPLNSALARRKVEHLRAHFPSQATRRWFTDRVFLGLLAVRGLECKAADGYAEAFYCRKVVVG